MCHSTRRYATSPKMHAALERLRSGAPCPSQDTTAARAKDFVISARDIGAP